MNRLLLFCFLLLSSTLTAQVKVPPVSTLESGEDHNDWLKLVFDAHQEFRIASGAFVLKHGYGSEEHLRFRRKAEARDSLLRVRINAYLDRFGFPGPSKAVAENRDKMREEFMRRTKDFPMEDTTLRDSLISVFRASFPTEWTVRDYGYIVIEVLQSEPDFYRRCETISLLRHEYETGRVALVSMLSFLRNTYRIRFGEELSIETGTTERERLAMYARELSGCW